MLDMNLVIANNILEILKNQGKKQIDLAEGIGVSKQTISKMMNGGRSINAIELRAIGAYLGVPMDTLAKMPDEPVDTDVFHAFMGRVESDEARKALKIADEVSDLILFHSRVRKNGIAMMQPAEE